MGMKLEALEGSFSALSTPIFANKYSCESSRRDLHTLVIHSFAPLSNPKAKSAGEKEPPLPNLNVLFKNLLLLFAKVCQILL